MGPPFVIAAVKVAELPVHIVVPGFALMLMVGVTLVTDCVIVLLVGATGSGQFVALLVITQAMVLPFASVLSL